jgi:hypothetical protein
MLSRSIIVLGAPALLAAQAKPKPKPSPIPTLAEVNAKAPSVPGLPTHRVALTESRRIDGKRWGTVAISTMNSGPRGEVAVVTNGSVGGAQNSYQTLALFDSTGRRLWSINTGRDAELGSIGSFGWGKPSFWVFDGRFNQIALIDRGTVTRSLEMPTWIRPSWTERKNYPVFGSFYVESFLDDGSMVGTPSRPHSVGAGAAFDSTKEVVVHATADGVIDRTIADVPNYTTEWRRQYDEWARSGANGNFPPAKSTLNTRQWPMYRVTWDGTRVGLVSADSSHDAVDSVTVTMHDGKGVKVFTTRFAFPRRSWSDAQVDSLAKERYPRLEPALRRERARSMRRVVSDVDHFLVGGDGSVWVTMRDMGGAWPVVGIDPAGRIIGTLYLPRTYSIVGADKGAVWLVDKRNTIKDLVRYTWR